MKQIAAMTAEFTQEQIAAIETSPETVLDMGGERIGVTAADFEISSEDMPGWLVASEGKLTVALDITLTDDLRAEGVARELINRIQNIRKDSGFEVTDRIRVEIADCPWWLTPWPGTRDTSPRRRWPWRSAPPPNPREPLSPMPKSTNSPCASP